MRSDGFLIDASLCPCGQARRNKEELSANSAEEGISGLLFPYIQCLPKIAKYQDVSETTLIPRQLQGTQVRECANTFRGLAQMKR